MDFSRYDRVRPLLWNGDSLRVLDQRVLPHRQEYLDCRDHAQVVEAIKTLAVRGAPAIGIAGAYGVVLAARAVTAADGAEALAHIATPLQELEHARPTAVNLAWAVRRMAAALRAAGAGWRHVVEAEAVAIQVEDLAANHAMGRIAEVYASETRPWLQGSRLTVWELLQDGIEATLIVDSASAYLMQTGRLDAVIVGADRICANGDVANKIGTYAHALAAKAHGLKVMVVAPSTTVDMATAQGADIEIEQRGAAELTHIAGVEVGARAAKVYNPVFDVTPADRIDFLVTEKGVIERPDRAKMAACFGAVSSP